MLRFACFIVLIAVASAMKLKFTDCGSSNIQEFRIDQCTSDPCTLKKGDSIHVEVDLNSNQDTSKATIMLTAKIGETDVPLPIETDACAKGRLPCPLKKNQKYTLKYDWTLPKTLPSVSTTVTAKLTGDGGQIACGSIKLSVE